VTPVFLMIVALVGAAYILLQAGSGGEAVDTTPNPATVALAQAIAAAEGFNVPGSRPARNHNPGDVTQDLIGKAVGIDGPFPVYATDADGWANLYAQINLWFSGGSAHATGDSTISQIASFYTTDSPPGAQATWALNVANAVGVTVDTPINQISA
jgi:hypothetical protein